MPCRPLLTIAAASLIVSACALAPRGELLPGAESVQLVTDTPRGDFQELGRLTGYGGPGCENPANFDDSRRHAWVSLRNKAVDQGATHVRVIGTGELETRGNCFQDQFQVSGIGFRRQATAPAPAAPTIESPLTAPAPEPAPAAAPADSRSTADKLGELVRLRERGLVSEQEYQNLRDRVLENAFGD